MISEKKISPEFFGEITTNDFERIQNENLNSIKQMNQNQIDYAQEIYKDYSKIFSEIQMKKKSDSQNDEKTEENFNKENLLESIKKLSHIEIFLKYTYFDHKNDYLILEANNIDYLLEHTNYNSLHQLSVTITNSQTALTQVSFAIQKIKSILYYLYQTSKKNKLGYMSFTNNTTILKVHIYEVLDILEKEYSLSQLLIIEMKKSNNVSVMISCLDIFNIFCRINYGFLKIFDNYKVTSQVLDIFEQFESNKASWLSEIVNSGILEVIWKSVEVTLKYKRY